MSVYSHKNNFSILRVQCFQWLAVVLLILSGLHFAWSAESVQGINTRSVIDGKQASLPVAWVIEEAKGFAFEYRSGHKILLLFSRNAQGSIVATKEFLLLPKGDVVPSSLNALDVIRTPIKRLITTSTTHLGLIDALQGHEVLIGHANSFVWSEKIQRSIADGRVAITGANSTLNIELVLNMKPDVYMAVAQANTTNNGHSILEDSGTAIIENAEYLEHSLLGRAEWIKLMGALLGKEEEAMQIFSTVKESYVALTRLAESASDKPIILPNSPFRGTWYVPGAESYFSKLITDAGGDYGWQKEGGRASQALSFEYMIKQGISADIWLNPSVESNEIDVLIKIDSRLAILQPLQSGEVYTYTRRISNNGTNDYWESGVVYPNKILADLIKIFHPSILPNHQLYYYQKMK